MKKGLQFTAILCVLLLFSGSNLMAQKDKADRPSPPAIATQTVGDLTITINYSQPSVKGREIWGELVKYDKVWRTGANEATTITFNKDVHVHRKPVPAGTYSVFTKPAKNGDWVVIINTDTTLWGAYDYDINKNITEFEVKPREIESMYEKMTFSINEVGEVTFAWDHLSWSFSVVEKK